MNTDKKSLPLQDLAGLLLETPIESRPSRLFDPKGMKRWLRGLNWLFMLTVVVPTLVAAVYYGFIASDVFVSTSSFVVQSVQDQEQMSSNFGSLLKSASSGSNDADTAAVQEFMKSRDALRQLEADAGIRQAYENSSIDRINRFGGLLGRDKSFEALYRYYNKRIVTINPSETSSAISELEVRAFTPDNAYGINNRLLEMGEKLVNDLNQRLQQDLVRFAQSEVDTAEKKAEASNLALAAYRNANSLVDPEHQSSLQLDLSLKLQEDLIESENRLAQLRLSSSNNPQIPGLRERIKNLQSEISGEMIKATGDTGSLTNKASNYDQLIFERDFSQKQLAEALNFLDQSRNEAQRKQLYLKRIVEPNTPDHGIEPKRARDVLFTLILGLVIWGILSLFVAGVREHQQ